MAVSRAAVSQTGVKRRSVARARCRSSGPFQNPTPNPARKRGAQCRGLHLRRAVYVAPQQIGLELHEQVVARRAAVHARIGHPWASRFRHEAEVVAVAQGLQQTLDVGRRELFRQLLDGEFAQRQRVAEALEFGAGALGIFDDEMPQAAGCLAAGRRQVVAPDGFAEGDRKQEKRCGHGTETAAGSGQGDAFGAQHVAQRDQRQADQRGGIVAAERGEERYAQSLGAGRAGAVECFFLVEVSLYLGIGQFAQAHFGWHAAAMHPAAGDVEQAQSGMEIHGLATHRSQLRGGILACPGLADNGSGRTRRPGRPMISASGKRAVTARALASARRRAVAAADSLRQGRLTGIRGHSRTVCAGDSAIPADTAKWRQVRCEAEWPLSLLKSSKW